MLNIVLVLRVAAAVAGLALFGQGVLFILAGETRDQNIFYRALKTLTAPLIRFVRFITPRLVPDRYIGVVALCFAAGVWLALTLVQRQLMPEAAE